MHIPADAFRHTSGPHKARIVIVGEAWGENEEALGRPFVGESGKDLWRMLGEAAGGKIAPEAHAKASALHKYGLAWVREREEWLGEAGILLTNVLALRPSGNKLANVCLTKAELPPGYDFPPFHKDGTINLFLHPDLFPEVNRLYEEIREAEPAIIIALGNAACWSVLRATNITSIRGTITGSILSGTSGAPIKVLPTFHPAAVMRQWSWRPIVVADLMKAFRESDFPEIRRPARSVIINPSLGEASAWAQSALTDATILSCDTETEGRQIKMISFARSTTDALVVPFWDKAKPGWSYWPTEREEYEAWRIVRDLLESPIPKLWQNTMYDAQYLWRRGIRPQNCLYDPMLLHHSIFPEMQKGLGFLGSIYTNEASWKLMRKRKMDTEKRDE